MVDHAQVRVSLHLATQQLHHVPLGDREDLPEGVLVVRSFLRSCHVCVGEVETVGSDRLNARLPNVGVYLEKNSKMTQIAMKE